MCPDSLNYMNKPITILQYFYKYQSIYWPSKNEYERMALLSIIGSISSGVKQIAHHIKNAELLGQTGKDPQSTINKSGDKQMKIDVLSNQIFKSCLIDSGAVALLGSEEEDNAIIAPLSNNASNQRYSICFDPLDGSSNIDAAIAVGTIWGIWMLNEQDLNLLSSEKDIDKQQSIANKMLLKKGSELIGAGYALYSTSTQIVLSFGAVDHSNMNVMTFTLDTNIGEFVLTKPNTAIPRSKGIYAINEGNYSVWPKWVQLFTDYIKQTQQNVNVPENLAVSNRYSLRYVGSMVADVHRTMLYGGIFAYPEDTKNTRGKLRYLYEAAPMAFIIETAGGLSCTSCKSNASILHYTPTHLHDRVPVYIGSKQQISLINYFKNLN